MRIELSDFHEAMEAIVPGSSDGVTEATRVADLPIDSLDTFQVFSELEEKSRKPVTNAAYDNIITVQDVIDYFKAV